MGVKFRPFLTSFAATSAALVILSCGKPYLAVAPDGFAVYPARYTYRAITPEGVMYRIRHVKNKPSADLAFWHEALKKRMVDAGYRLVQDTAYEINTFKHVSLKLASPVGINDYIYFIDISTNNKKIIIIEAAGEALLFEKSQAAILEAVQRMKIKQ